MIQYNRSTGILETQVYGRIRSHPFSLILTAQHGLPASHAEVSQLAMERSILRV